MEPVDQREVSLLAKPSSAHILTLPAYQLHMSTKSVNFASGSVLSISFPQVNPPQAIFHYLPADATFMHVIIIHSYLMQASHRADNAACHF